MPGNWEVDPYSMLVTYRPERPPSLAQAFRPALMIEILASPEGETSISPTHIVHHIRHYIFLKTWQPTVNSLLADEFVNSELSDTKWLVFRNHAIARLKQVDLDQKSELIFRYNGYVEGGVWTIHLDEPDGTVLKTILVAKTNGWKITSVDFPPGKGVHDLYFTYTNSNLKKPDDNGMLFDWFYFTNPLEGKDKKGYDEINRMFWELLDAPVTTTPIMMDNPPDMHRASYVFERGNWLVKGEAVQPDVPRSLNPFPKNTQRNRLGLAKWLKANKIHLPQEQW